MEKESNLKKKWVAMQKLVADKSATRSRLTRDVSSTSPTNSMRLELVSSLSATSRGSRRQTRDVSSLTRVGLEEVPAVEFRI
jgi:hypothetical protein